MRDMFDITNDGLFTHNTVKHMKKTFLTICSALAITLASAQEYTWYDIVNGVIETSGSRPDCISIFAVDNNTVIGGTSFGIYTSNDNGANWSLSSSHYFICQKVVKLANGRLVAVGKGMVSLNGKHVMVSDDNGASWMPITFNPNESNIEIRDVAIDVNGNLYANSYSNSSTAAIGVYKSTNNGDTWTQLGSAGLPSGILFVGSVYTEDGNTILLGTNKGVSKSTDGGATFTNASGLSDYNYRFAKQSNGTILLSGDDGIYASTDTGSTFTHAITTSSFIFDFLLKEDTVVAAVYNGGIVKYDPTSYVGVALVGSGTNGLSSLRLRGIGMNSAGDYFAATEGTNSTNGRKFHTTIAGGSTGINKVETLSFDLYPNPASNTVNLSGLSNGAIIDVVDVAGKVVYSTVAAGNTHSLALSDLANGIYYVQVKTANAAGIQKLQIAK